jgi:hypothetical protein
MAGDSKMVVGRRGGKLSLNRTRLRFQWFS